MLNWQRVNLNFGVRSASQTTQTWCRPHTWDDLRFLAARLQWPRLHRKYLVLHQGVDVLGWIAETGVISLITTSSKGLGSRTLHLRISEPCFKMNFLVPISGSNAVTWLLLPDMLRPFRPLSWNLLGRLQANLLRWHHPHRSRVSACLVLVKLVKMSTCYSLWRKMLRLFSESA